MRAGSLSRWSAVLAALLWVAMAGAPLAACNPDPPRHPVLAGHAYDELAADLFTREASTVVAARLTLRVDLELAPGEGPGPNSDYVFEVLEGWKTVVPRRLTVGGYWLDCAVEPRRGRSYLLYLEGGRLLHAVPVADIDFELGLLGQPDWYYDAGGRLVQLPEE